MSGDILDLIDAAVDDWETCGDAMRWNPDAEDQPPVARWPMPGDFLADFTRRFEEAVRQAAPIFAATGVTFERAAAAMGAFGSCLPEVRVLRDAMLDHDLRVGILKAYRVRPHHLGIGTGGSVEAGRRRHVKSPKPETTSHRPHVPASVVTVPVRQGKLGYFIQRGSRRTAHSDLGTLTTESAPAGCVGKAYSTANGDVAGSSPAEASAL